MCKTTIFRGYTEHPLNISISPLISFAEIGPITQAARAVNAAGIYFKEMLHCIALASLSNDIFHFFFFKMLGLNTNISLSLSSLFLTGKSVGRYIGMGR